MSGGKVLAARPIPTSKSYRDAVAKIIKRVMLQQHLSDVELADRLGCSRSTIRNAIRQTSDLGAVILLRIEHGFGSGEIDLSLELAGSNACPVEIDEEGDDILPVLGAAITVIAEARAPTSLGGREEVHTELLPMEAVLLKLRRCINRRLAQIARIRGC